MAGILFVHSNFPGQFGFIAAEMRRAGVPCAAIASETGRELAGIPLLRWRAGRGTTPGLFPPATRAEADMIRGRAAAECALRLKAAGFDPDLVVGHPGWGETLFLKEVFPAAKLILHGEFFYRSEGLDVGFDPEFGAPDFDERLRVQAKNATLALALAEADRIVCPTAFQASVLPPVFAPRVSVIHEGVDTDAVRRRAGAAVTLPSGRVLDGSVPVITFVNRRFEPLRGFHVFLRALPALLAAVPEAEALLIGSDEPGGYGRAPPDGTTWKEHYLAELGPALDPARVHFLGRVPHGDMVDAFSISAAHVYYTYPFVLSWSLLEAMAADCVVLASDTAPVRDAVTHGLNGILNDFFDVPALSDAMIAACRTPDAFRELRSEARASVVARFDRSRICRPAWLGLIGEVRRAP